MMLRMFGLMAALLTIAFCLTVPVMAQAGKKDDKNVEKKDKAKDKAEKEKLDKDLKAAQEKVEKAKLRFNDESVDITVVTITALVKFGDPTAEGFRFVSKGKKVIAPGLEIHLGKLVGSMGKSGSWQVVAAPAEDGVAVKGPDRERLVVFVPFDGDGFGTPVLLEGTHNGVGMEYRNTATGYFLISRTLKKK